MNETKQSPFVDYDSFRDHIATVDEHGKRNWIYPKKPEGWFHNKRVIVSIVLLGLLFVGPFLRWGGQPLFLFNILERKFIIFGVTFWPQDMHLLALAMITFFVFIVLFTVVFGRVWCGWACPQTIFMEMVFRKIEYWLEGDAGQQRRLARQPWNAEKIRKRVIKYALFAVVSFLIGNLVMAYIVGTEELAKIVTEGPLENWGKFTFVLIFSSIFMFVFSYMREQICIAICPYGRLQGVLLDKESIVVAYDEVRGEPRGRLKRGQDFSDRGDCIDCKMCIAVCPTGIDIRNGTQLECVNCTACIDACDTIMDKVDRPRGLIRYASRNMIEQGRSFKFTTRVAAYSVVLVLLLGVLGFSLAGRSPVEATILRARGQMYQRTDEGNIRNLYNLQIVNKTRETYPLRIEVLKPEGATVTLIGRQITVAPQDLSKGSFFIELPPGALDGNKTKVVIGIYDGDRLLDKGSASFLGPIQIK